LSISSPNLALPSPGSGAPVASPWSNAISGIMRSRLLSCPYIPTGFDRQGLIDTNRQRILTLLGCTEHDWASWEWQVSRRLVDAALIADVLNLDLAQTEELSAPDLAGTWSVTPYYLSLMSPDPACPVRLQALPSAAGPAGGGVATRRRRRADIAVAGRDRSHAILRVAGQCTLMCQYCSLCRRNRVPGAGGAGEAEVRAHLERNLAHVATKTKAHDLLVTGADPLLLSDSTLSWLMEALRAVPQFTHVTVESRALATLPQRVTPGLCSALAGGPQVTVATRFNSPLEVCRESAEACEGLLAAGVELENHPVMLPGVNDHAYARKRLRDSLRQIGFSTAKKNRGL
jgi:glutamate 2,3-aminomutase